MNQSQFIALAIVTCASLAGKIQAGLVDSTNAQHIPFPDARLAVSGLPWFEEDKPALRRLPLQTPRDTRAELDEGHGAVDAGSLITSLTEHLIERMSHSILDLNTAIDTLEETEADCTEDQMLREISRIRRECLALKRYMSPQHEALENIAQDAPDWFEDHDRREIAESVDRLRRYLEDLDISKESALVMQDDVRARVLERNSRAQSQLAVVATVFLPLNFMAGLLGMNVAGIPDAQNPLAFWEVLAICGVIVLAQMILFRRLKWF